jgi:hypothetical protein
MGVPSGSSAQTSSGSSPRGMSTATSSSSGFVLDVVNLIIGHTGEVVFGNSFTKPPDVFRSHAFVYSRVFATW